MRAASSGRSESPGPWHELAAQAVLWVALCAAFLAFRAALAFGFRAKLSPDTGLEGFARCFLIGARFDVSIATFALLPSLVPAVVALAVPLGPWPQRIRRALAPALLALCAVVFAVDAAYFAEYGDQFDAWVMGLVYDDRGAIVSTVWKTYPVTRILAACALGTLAASLGLSRAIRAAERHFALPAERAHRPWRVTAVVLVTALVAVGARGSVGRRPIQEKDAATTGDPFLNKLVPNPFFALYRALRNQEQLDTPEGVRAFLPDGNVRAAARMLFPAHVDAEDLDQSILQLARGSGAARPDHVFLVVMESYDSWAMEPKFASLHLTDRLAALGRAGIQVWPFVSAGSGTMKSLGAIVTGLPATGLFPNYQPAVRNGVPSTAAPIFESLGYRTRFFYGGYLSWERVGDFAREQHFQEVHGGDEMSAKLSGNEWGVDDDVLFRFVLEHTSEQPTFDVIMSTSYHPPFSVDLAAHGFARETLAANPLCAGLSADQLRALGHLWYSDQSLGDFVAQVGQRLRRPLFAITGDHYSREESVNQRPTLFESHAVPLVLYGPEILSGVTPPAGLAGSHLDIVPTLVGLIAPRGFPFHAFGRDLLDPRGRQAGYGAGVVMTPEFIVDTQPPLRVETLAGALPEPPVDPREWVQRSRALQGLGWWRTRNGPAWPAD